MKKGNPYDGKYVERLSDEGKKAEREYAKENNINLNYYKASEDYANDKKLSELMLEKRRKLLRKRLAEDLASGTLVRSPNEYIDELSDLAAYENENNPEKARLYNYIAQPDMKEHEKYRNAPKIYNAEDLDYEEVDKALKESGFKMQEVERPSLFETLKQRLRK